MTNIMNIMDQGIAVIEGAMEILEKALINKDVLVEAIETSERDQEPFGYFCAYKLSFDADDSVITYDKLLYSSQFGLQGESPGIDITSGKLTSGISGTWRIDFSLNAS